ncbi:MAG: ExeA family protein [Thermoguttaceae bacterium]
MSNRPFAAAPVKEQYFPATSIESARIALSRCLQRGEGVGIVIGPAGTGKTMLCKILAEEMKKTFPLTELACGRLGTRRSLYQAILYGLGEPFRDMDEGELRLALVDYLTLNKRTQQGMALIVDEAHTLPLRLLDEIRMLTNLAAQGQPLLRLLLAADGSLEERLASPKMDSFNQRISARCYLEPLTRSEVINYIHAHVHWSGARDADLFSEDACHSVFQATDGVPRLINQLCDHALLLAYVAGQEQIDSTKIEEAWTDLQQLPAPFSNESRQEQGGVIEFGCFDDSFDESPSGNVEEHNASAGGTSLRVTGDFEECELDLSASDSQSTPADDAMAKEADDLQPRQDAKPEIELVFDEPDHPFQEEFQCEELVSDRYGAMNAINNLSQTAAPASTVRNQSPMSENAISPVCGEQPQGECSIFRGQDATGDHENGTFPLEPDLAASSSSDAKIRTSPPQDDSPMPQDDSPIENASKIVEDVESLTIALAAVEELAQGESQAIPERRKPEFRRLFAKLRQS